VSSVCEVPVALGSHAGTGRVGSKVALGQASPERSRARKVANAVAPNLY